MAYKTISLGLLLSFLQYYLVMGSDKPCSGHTVKFEQLKNCAEVKSPGAKLLNVTFTLTDDCHLVPRGCFKVIKKLTAAKIEYSVSKPPLKKKGSEDLCKTLANPDTQKSLETYKSIPRKCPISPGDYCFTKGSSNIEQLNSKTLNMIAGTTTGTINLEYEGSSDKACVEFKIVITKK